MTVNNRYNSIRHKLRIAKNAPHFKESMINVRNPFMIKQWMKKCKYIDILLINPNFLFLIRLTCLYIQKILSKTVSLSDVKKWPCDYWFGLKVS